MYKRQSIMWRDRAPRCHLLRADRPDTSSRVTSRSLSARVSICFGAERRTTAALPQERLTPHFLTKLSPALASGAQVVGVLIHNRQVAGSIPVSVQALVTGRTPDWPEADGWCFSFSLPRPESEQHRNNMKVPQGQLWRDRSPPREAAGRRHSEGSPEPGARWLSCPSHARVPVPPTCSSFHLPDRQGGGGLPGGRSSCRLLLHAKANLRL